MTQPPEPTPANPRIEVHFELQVGPDGNPWIKCTLQVGLASFAFLATESQAEQLALVFAGGFGEGSVAARRARLGLILFGHDGVSLVNGQLVNGARPT
jgi:hypothetical protein